MSFEWTPQHIASLISLWDEGITTSEIGARLGITKNAVVGKAHRLGLPKRKLSSPHIASDRPAPIRNPLIKPQAPKPQAPGLSRRATASKNHPRNNGQPAQIIKSATFVPKKNLPTAHGDHGTNVTDKEDGISADVIPMEKLQQGMCCWPQGDPQSETFRFCGRPVHEDRPYCYEHCQRAYVRISRDGRKIAFV